MIEAHWCKGQHQERALCKWAEGIIDTGAIDFGECRCLAILDDGDLIAGVIFHNWDERSETIELSAAAIDRRWLTRPVINKIMEYAFSVAQCVYTRTHENHPTLHRIYQALGWNRHVIPNLRGRGVADVIHTQTDAGWAGSRFNLRNRNGQKVKSSQAA